MYWLFIIVLMQMMGCGTPKVLGPNHETGDLVIDLPGGEKMAFVWIDWPSQGTWYE